MFSEDMFNAVIEGRKTQIRRIVKPQPDELDLKSWSTFERTRPRYKVGETVYIKESYYITHYQGGLMDLEQKESVIYKYNTKYENYEWAWENKLSMPEKYSRYFIEFTGIRCERVRSINNEDCLKEGIIESKYIRKHYKYKRDGYLYNTLKDAYAAMFDSINGKGAWESNPYVWIYSFILKK